MFYIAVILILFFAIYYWRFFFFFRDPERIIPDGDNIVSPAEGTIVYIKEIKGNEVPISIKNKKEVKLQEIFGDSVVYRESSYLVGIFMHPTNVHVNRAPITGKIEKIIYTPNKNLAMTLMWWRILLGLRPYEFYSKHILQNERNTILFKGKIPVFIVQIADIYVNKIECWVREHEEVKKGQRIGMIKMGSQVDILFPSANINKLNIILGQKVKAGETIIASMS